jgi:uncharacterized protein (DUF885 family)
MEAEYILNTAETIRQQLVHLTDIHILMSWGINKLTATTINGMAALKFNVRGRLHHGSGIIAYDDGSDYYQIFLRNTTGDRKIAEDVEFESLSSIIDRNIETGDNAEEYSQFCHEEFRKLMHGDF